MMMMMIDGADDARLTVPGLAGCLCVWRAPGWRAGGQRRSRAKQQAMLGGLENAGDGGAAGGAVLGVL